MVDDNAPNVNGICTVMFLSSPTTSECLVISASHKLKDQDEREQSRCNITPPSSVYQVEASQNIASITVQ